MSALLVLTDAATGVATFLSGAVDEVPEPEDVRPGWIALGSMLLLLVVTVLLWMNMRKQIKRIDFDDGVDRSQPRPGMPTVDDGTDRGEEPASGSAAGPAGDERR